MSIIKSIIAPALVVALSATQAFADTALITTKYGDYRGGVTSSVVPNVTTEVCKSLGHAASIQLAPNKTFSPDSHTIVSCVSDDGKKAEHFTYANGVSLTGSKQLSLIQR